MEKITSGDLEGGWQLPAPDQGLKSFLFSKCVSCCCQSVIHEHNAQSEHAIQGQSCGSFVNQGQALYQGTKYWRYGLFSRLVLSVIFLAFKRLHRVSCCLLQASSW